MSDVLDKLLNAATRERFLRGLGEDSTIHKAEVDRLLAIIRERFAAGDECAKSCRPGARFLRHAAAVQECERENT